MTRTPSHVRPSLRGGHTPARATSLTLWLALVFLSGCTPICSDCMKIDAMQKKQLDYLPTPEKPKPTIWTGDEIPRRVETRLVLEPIQWIEPQTFDPDGSYTI